jgi:hypothetical protein
MRPQWRRTYRASDMAEWLMNRYTEPTRETTQRREPREVRIMMPRLPGTGRAGGIVAAIVAVIVLIVVLSAVHLLPQLRNPFGETTTVRSEPVILKSITALSRYEAASGSFEVVVDLTQKASILPSFLAGSETLFIGQGTDIAYVDFSGLKSQALQVSKDRTTVTVSLPKAQLEPAQLNVDQSYVYAQQQGLFNRIGNFFSGNPNSQQQVYEIAEQKIQTAAQQSPLLAEAQKNTQGMLDGMLSSLGFTHVTVTFTG